MDKIEIRTIDNGYILKSYIWEYDDEKTGKPIYLPMEEVYEIEEDDGKETVIRLLEDIAEKLGFSYDKFSDKNINIKFNKK